MSTAPLLTDTQIRYIDAINQLSADGIPPTYSEIAAFLCVRKNAVYEMVSRLEAKGYVKIRRGISRGIQTEQATLV